MFVTLPGLLEYHTVIVLKSQSRRPGCSASAHQLQAFLLELTQNLVAWVTARKEIVIVLRGEGLLVLQYLARVSDSQSHLNGSFDPAPLYNWKVTQLMLKV